MVSQYLKYLKCWYSTHWSIHNWEPYCWFLIYYRPIFNILKEAIQKDLYTVFSWINSSCGSVFAFCSFLIRLHIREFIRDLTDSPYHLRPCIIYSAESPLYVSLTHLKNFQRLYRILMGRDKKQPYCTVLVTRKFEISVAWG